MLKEIIVCIKQVPASSNVQIDPTSGVLIRDGNNSKMNPYDLYAIEAALKIKEATGAKVNVLTMGPPAANAVLDEALWMGADDAYLLTDRKFAGADVVATSFTLAQGIKRIGNFDLVICGKQTTDGDTAQVGPEMGEHLGIPYACYVDKIEECKDDEIIVRVNMDKVYETIAIKYPCLITVDKAIATPRLPSYKRSVAFKEHQNHNITLLDLEDKSEDHYGLKGSPTQVEAMFNPERNKSKVVLKGTSDELANKLYDVLKESKYI